MNVLVHACDLGYFACKYEVFFNWACLCVQEFNDQSIIEKENNVKELSFQPYKDYPTFLNL